MTSPSPRRIRTLLAAVLLAALGATLLAGTAVQPASAAAKPPFNATIKLNRATTPVGGTVTVNGYVKPFKKGLPVILQKRGVDKPWNFEARTTMSATGRYSFSTKPSTAGVRFYRVVVPASAARRTTATLGQKVTVYRWLNLNQVAARSQQGTAADSSVAINGVNYGKAFRGYPYYNEGFIDWNLERDCTRLRGRVGNSDDSDALAQANINITADGDSLFAKSFGLTQSQVISRDLTDVFRLAFTWTSTNPDGTVEDQSGASPVLAEAEVYCAF